jgi:hypothetical protein
MSDIAERLRSASLLRRSPPSTSPTTARAYSGTLASSGLKASCRSGSARVTAPVDRRTGSSSRTRQRQQ